MNGNGFGSIPPAVKNLIIINVLMFLVMQLVPDFMIRTFALFYPASPHFKLFQPVTHMFMHADFFHLFFNMYVLWMFGRVTEQVWGARKFLFYYFFTGLGAVGMSIFTQWLASTISINSPVLGASGAVYGVLVAFAVMYPDVELQLIFPPIRFKAIWLAAICVLVELLLGVIGSNDHIAHFAHLGGMLFGFILVRYWKRKGTLFRNDDFGHR